ncbi:MAG: adenylate kinase-like kinase [Parcubacteria group bacterium Gr01-1014_33]|nr:MAG: adenylate kinase-like kinase [Parcubacteria group bacterium Gr01-1014_33]
MEYHLENKLTISLLGRSGSGKGTQALFAVEKLKREGSIHISTGALLRRLMRRSTPAGRITRDIMERGDLHPSWVAAYTWFKIIFEQRGSERHLVFDGAPRRIWEAKLLDEVMKWHGRLMPLCVYIDVSRREAMRRLLARGRADDTVVAIENRLDYFVKDVVPVLRYYKHRNRLIRVNGEQPPEKVWNDIDKALRKKLEKKWPRS